MATASSTALSSPLFLSAAGKWFLQSGIQEPEGGVARYYRIDLGRNNRISTEITGYTISALCYLHRQTGVAAYRQSAESAGRFLVRQCWDPDLQIFPFEWPQTTVVEENRAYFFDCGIIVRGLLNLWRLTSDREFLDTAVACGQGMFRRFEQSGQFAPILQLPGCEPLPFGGSWSNNPGCYQLKSALAWFELWEATGDASFLGHYETALARALTNDADFLPGTAEPLRVMDRLHAYSYFLEALLPVSPRPECASAIVHGISKVASYLRELRPQFARSDVYGQLLRVRLFADQLGVTPLDQTQAKEEAEAMMEFQYRHEDPRLDGGFSFGSRRGELMPYANPVSTAFCVQSLGMWHARRSNGEIQETWRDLI